MRASPILLSLTFLAACAAGGTVVEDPPGGGTAGTAGSSTAGSAGVPGKGGAAGSEQGGGAGAPGGGGGAPAGGSAGDAGAAGATSAGAAGVAGSGGDAGAGGGSGSGGGSGASGGAGTAGASGGGGAGGAGASGAGGGGTAGASGGGGAGAGGASGSGGAGAGGASGSGGGGAGGASGGGGAGAGGSGGSAGAGGSAGGAGASPGPRVLAVVTQASAAPYVATFTDAGGWVDAPPVASTLVGRAGVARRGDDALVVMRQPSNALVSATWSGGALSSFAPLPGFPNAADGVSLSSSADGAQLALAYLGTDNKHFGAVFSAVAGIPMMSALGSDMPQAFGDTSASVAVGGSVAHAAYSGTNEGLYYLSHGGSQWSTSAAIAGAGSKKAISPSVVVAGGKPSVVYVEGGGNPTERVCIAQNGGGGFGAPVCLPNALTSRAVGAAALSNGDVVVAWHGRESIGNDQRIFAARFSGGAWGNIVEVDPLQDVTGAPVVVAGLAGADAEILYSKGGKLKHARLVGTVATVTPVGGVGANEVGAAVIP